MYIPANTKHLNNMFTRSAKRLRRWFNIVQMLYKCVVFTGVAAEPNLSGGIINQICQFDLKTMLHLKKNICGMKSYTADYWMTCYLLK